MRKSLLERFNISIPSNMDDCNLVGLDYGDGEVSASLVLWDSVNQQIKIRHISIFSAQTYEKAVNAYYISPKTERLIPDVQETELNENDGGVRYYNFKRCPGSPEAKSLFRKDDKTTAPLSNQEVMVKGFNVLVNTLFEENPSLLERSKPTIILVGRPASAAWAKNELEYARMLEKGLTIKNVRVAVQSESSAALARELDPQWGAQRVKRGEIVVVLDNGSSTFDIAVITPKGIPEGGEDSYQFGGNQLDENLLSLMWNALEKEYPDKQPRTLHGHKLNLRLKKEQYYGVRGDSFDDQRYRMEFMGESDERGRRPQGRFEVDQAAMDAALRTMPVKAVHFTESLGKAMPEKPLQCESWLEACGTIYDKFYQEMKKFFNKPNPSGDPKHPVIPDRVILSGGVSVMPEVQREVERAFGVAPTPSQCPNFAVSEGLSYVLGCEIKKAEYLRKLLKKLPAILPDAASLRECIISAGIDKDWSSFRDAMRKWAMAPGNLSYNDCIEQWSPAVCRSCQTEGLEVCKSCQKASPGTFDRNLRNRVQIGAEMWYKDKQIESKILKELKHDFAEMFPDYVDQFQFDFPQMNWASLQGVIVWIIFGTRFFLMPASFDGPLDFDISKKCNYDHRQKTYATFCSFEESVRNGGSRQISYREQVEKGVWMFKHKEWESRTRTLTYDGLRSSYESGIPLAKAEDIRKEILAMLAEPLKDYVESITPYFNMTAQQM